MHLMTPFCTISIGMRRVSVATWLKPRFFLSTLACSNADSFRRTCPFSLRTIRIHSANQIAYPLAANHDDKATDMAGGPRPRLRQTVLGSKGKDEEAVHRPGTRKRATQVINHTSIDRAIVCLSSMDHLSAMMKGRRGQEMTGSEVRHPKRSVSRERDRM